MKTTSVLALASAVALFANIGLADDDAHEADRGLEGSLRAAINERHVHINVHKGIVTLDGKVATQADRERIESLVRNTPGVSAIKDKLEVAMPSPGVYGANPSTIPVYATPPPAVATPAPPTTVLTPPSTVVTPPTTTVITPAAPLVIPEYPQLSVRAATPGDQAIAQGIAAQLRADALPPAGMQNINISVMNGNVSVQGAVTSRLQHDAIIAAIQRAGGMTAIYDQLQVNG